MKDYKCTWNAKCLAYTHQHVLAQILSILEQPDPVTTYMIFGNDILITGRMGYQASSFNQKNRRKRREHTCVKVNGA